MTTAGVNVALMWSVPPENRAMAMALSVIIIHLLGDVPSPVVIGAIDLKNAPQTTFLVTCSWLGWAVFCWGAAWIMAKRRVVKEKRKLSGIEEWDERRSSGGDALKTSSPTGYVYEHPSSCGYEDTDTDKDGPPAW